MEFLAMFNILAIILVTFAFIFNVLKKYQNGKKLPPGPWKLPLIGNIHQLYGGLPHQIFRDLAKKHGPIMHLHVGEMSLILVSSARLAKEVLKTHDPVFAGRPSTQVTRVLFYDCEDIHGPAFDDCSRQMRKLWTYDLLNVKNARLLAPVRQVEGDNLIASIRNYGNTGESVNLSEKISHYTISVIWKAIFGMVIERQEEFVNIYNKFSNLVGGVNLPDLFPSLKALHFLSGMMPKLLKLHKKIDNIFENIIDEHKHNFAAKRCSGEGGKEDLIDSLLRLKESGNLQFPMTNKRMKAIIFAYFAAGTESSTAAAIWVMSELIRNPQVMKKAKNEIRRKYLGKEFIDEAGMNDLKYLNSVIKETLRLHPPAPLLVPRSCTEDYVIDGYNIPANTIVMVNVWAIGRDPTIWSDPESFIPERFDNNMTDFMGNNFELIPFGAGKRMCAGIHLAIPNLKLPIILLLKHFDWEMPVGLKPDDFDMTEKAGGTCGRKTDLCLIPIKSEPQ